MKKQDLVAYVMGSTQASRRQAEGTLSAVVDLMLEALASGEAVDLRRFGRFELRISRAHAARHPKTGVIRQLGEQRCVLFRPSKLL